MPMTKESRLAKYQRLRYSGVCSSCRKEWAGPQVMCDECRKKNEDRRKRLREERENKGLCNRCGKHPIILGTKYCEACAAQAKKHKDSKATTKKRLQKYHKVYKPVLQTRRKEYKANGLCADCGETKAEFGVMCAECYKKRREVYERSKVRYLSKLHCNGDCVNCTSLWCVDSGDDIELTAEEKALSRELDNEATADERRWKKETNKAIKNANNRVKHNIGVIYQMEYLLDMEGSLDAHNSKRLQEARKHLEEAKEEINKLGGKIHVPRI